MDDVDCRVRGDGGTLPPRDDFTRLLSTSSSSNFFLLIDLDELLRLMRLSSGDSEEMGVVGVDIALPPTIKLVVLPRDFGVVTLLECLVFIVGVLGAAGLGLAPPLPPDELLVLVFMVGVDTEGSREEVRVTMLALVTEDASDLVLSMSSGLSGSSVISVLIFAVKRKTHIQNIYTNFKSQVYRYTILPIKPCPHNMIYRYTLYIYSTSLHSQTSLRLPFIIIQFN